MGHCALTEDGEPRRKGHQLSLEEQASHRALPYETLIRMWLKERLDTEARVRRENAGKA